MGFNWCDACMGKIRPDVDLRCNTCYKFDKYEDYNQKGRDKMSKMMEDWNQEAVRNGELKEVEKVEADKTEYVKPPLGIMPRDIHEEMRIKDICKALNNYAQESFDEMLMYTWAIELCDRLEYMIENKKGG